MIKTHEVSILKNNTLTYAIREYQNLKYSYY